MLSSVATPMFRAIGFTLAVAVSIMALIMLWIVGGATAFVLGRWCARLLGWE